MAVSVDYLANICGVVLDELVEGHVARRCWNRRFVHDFVHGMANACLRHLAMTRVTDVLCVEAMWGQMTETVLAFGKLQAALAHFDPLRSGFAVVAR